MENETETNKNPLPEWEDIGRFESEEWWDKRCAETELCQRYQDGRCPSCVGATTEVMIELRSGDRWCPYCGLMFFIQQVGDEIRMAAQKCQIYRELPEREARHIARRKQLLGPVEVVKDEEPLPAPVYSFGEEA